MADEIVKTKVKWGFGQIPHTTPEFAKWAARGVLYGLAILNLALSIFSDIPQHLKDVLGRYSIEIAAFVYGASKTFGVHIDGPEAVTDQDTATVTE